MANEIFKPIPDFENYQVSDFGRVKAIERIKKNQYSSFIVDERILKPAKDKGGYLYVYLNGNKFSYIHRLVAITFLDNPENKEQVNHIDGVKKNNFLNNLEWTTKSENVQHAYDIGLKTAIKGEDNKSAKLTEIEVLQIRGLHAGGANIYAISKLYPFNYSTIERVVKRISWKHI